VVNSFIYRQPKKQNTPAISAVKESYKHHHDYHQGQGNRRRICSTCTHTFWG